MENFANFEMPFEMPFPRTAPVPASVLSSATGQDIPNNLPSLWYSSASTQQKPSRPHVSFDDRVDQGFLGIRSKAQPQQLHRSQDLHPSPHHLHHQQPSIGRNQSASAHDLHADSSIYRDLTSSPGLMSLQVSSAANRSFYHPLDPKASSFSPPLAMGPLQNNTGRLIKTEMYKTETCRSFAVSGFCKYGPKCQFAHGDLELRLVRRHPRYKTKLCRNFATTGSCPYDARCRFIHGKPFDQPLVHTPPAQAITDGGSASALAHHPPLPADHRLVATDTQHGAVNMQDEYAEKYRLLQTSVNETQDDHAAGKVRMLNPSLNNMQDDYAGKLRALKYTLNATENYLDDLAESIKADQRLAPPPPRNMQTDRPVHKALPENEIDYPTTNVSHDYPENIAFRNAFMQLSTADSHVTFPLSDLSDRDTIHTPHHGARPAANAAVGENPGIIGSRFGSTSDQQYKSFFSLSGSNNRDVSLPGFSTDGKIGSRVADGSEFFEGNTHVAPASVRTARSRLPVFRNMAVNDNAQ